MENASKALLMAGGVLLVMLVIGLLLLAWGKFSEFYSKEDDLAEIKDIAEFNLQFTNYDRNDVHGYELISLANRVADYNFRYSNDEAARNNEGYSPITLIINMPTKLVNEKIAYGVSARLFTATQYSTSSINSGFITILNNLDDLEKKYGKQNLQNLGKSIQSIFLEEGNWTGELYTEEYKVNLKKEAIKKFNSIVSYKYASGDCITTIYNIKSCDYTNTRSISTQYQAIQNNFKDKAYMYYEYTQFKKAKFKSESRDITYDQTTGRIKQMVFDFYDVE